MKTLYDIIIRPILTEKSMMVVEKNNCYIFEVSPDCDKLAVKKAVEKIFNVKVKRLIYLILLQKREFLEIEKVLEVHLRKLM